MTSSAAIGFSVVLSLGCQDSLTSPPANSALEGSILVGDAARSLNENGEFVLSSNGDGTAPEITEDQAKALAAAMWHDAKSFITGTIEADRGGPIHAAALQPCRRAYYASSAYADVDPSYPPVIQKMLGPQWVVGLCYQGTQEVVVAVSAYATDAKLGGGRLRLEDPGVANFVAMGVPIGIEIPTAPEEIAAVVANASERRVASVPKLIMRARPHGPFVAVWQITLEAPVTLVGKASGVSRSEQTLFAGHLNGWAEPVLAAARAGAQENSTPLDILDYRPQRSGAIARLTVQRRVGVPRVMELVSTGGN